MTDVHKRFHAGGTILKSPVLINRVHIDIPLNYIHVEPDMWENYYLAAVNYLAWNKKGLLTQISSAFCSRHRDYLLQCADIEAAARGLDADSADFFELYCNWKSELPPYTSGQYPDFPASPLANIIDPDASMANRHNFANIRIGKLNAVLLRVLKNANRDAPAPVLFSRLTKYHFQHYGAGYTYQVAADAQNTIRPTLPSPED